MIAKNNNSKTAEKVRLRLEAISKINKDSIRVLEAYRGDSVLWEAVKKRTTKKIKVVGIDIKEGYRGAYLKGDNVKYLKTMNLSLFDIIDLDAYGTPFKQLETVFERGYKGLILCTFIQVRTTKLPFAMLYKIGYPPEIVKKNCFVCGVNGLEKVKAYLSLYGIDHITGYFLGLKNYFYFIRN